MKKVKKLSRDAKKIGPATSKATATPRHLLRHVKADPIDYKFKKPEGAPDRTKHEDSYPIAGPEDLFVRATEHNEQDLGELMFLAASAGWGDDYSIIWGQAKCGAGKVHAVFARKTA